MFHPWTYSYVSSTLLSPTPRHPPGEQVGCVSVLLALLRVQVLQKPISVHVHSSILDLRFQNELIKKNKKNILEQVQVWVTQS